MIPVSMAACNVDRVLGQAIKGNVPIRKKPISMSQREVEAEAKMSDRQ
jgi:hypothetical protein